MTICKMLFSTLSDLHIALEPEANETTAPVQAAGDLSQPT